MTLKEIDAGLQQGVRIPETNAYQKSRYPFGYLDFCFAVRDSNIQMQESGELLLAAGLDGGNTLHFIFQRKQNGNESLSVSSDFEKPLV